MPSKKKKIARAHDATVTIAHIETAQQTMYKLGPGSVLARVNFVEPQLTAFITASAKDIAANALIDCEMPRPLAQHLRERITALALMVYGSYNLAMYDAYKDFMKGTEVAALDMQPEPGSIPMPPTTDEGGTRAK